MVSVEYRAELRDAHFATSILRKIGATRIISLDVVDTYFNIPSGTLKKREAQDEPVDFVFYERKAIAGPKLCTFTIYSKEAAKQRYGVQPLPVLARVMKRRSIYMLGNVKIHIDDIEDIGTFIEFETLVSRELNARHCHQQINTLREKLAMLLGEPISQRYADLVLVA
ncbi:MAG: CYTH domain-containing protein [Phycisphaeraceae bacterium]|nr:CYTH domain-containing protein [Phycisphaerales bacterium]MCB9860831.1 CYTH domain-containing protein [Phycisphaeraceae bacterium]